MEGRQTHRKVFNMSRHLNDRFYLLLVISAIITKKWGMNEMFFLSFHAQIIITAFK